MDSVAGIFMGNAVGIIIGILILSLMMFVHELGHYLTGRALGFKIIEFSLFMGPVIASKTSRKTGIRYSLKLFPIGASVRFHGEEGMGEEASTDPDSFTEKPKWKRAVVIATGPAVNILTGLLALVILFSMTGFVTTTLSGTAAQSQAAAAGFAAGDRIVEVNGAPISTSVDYLVEMNFLADSRTVSIGYRKAGEGGILHADLVPVKEGEYVLGITVNKVKESGGLRIVAVDPASNSGSPVLKAGDILLAVEGVSIADRYAETSDLINGSKGGTLNVTVLRGGETLALQTKTSYHEYYSPRGLQFTEKTGFIASAEESMKYSVSVIRLTFKTISMVFSGEIKAKDSLSGPVGVVSMVGTVVTQKVPWTEKAAELLWMFALISLNLGVFNLLPIPALDGSHLLLIGVEAIRRKRLSVKVQEAIIAVGFLIIISLAVIGLIFDVMRIAGY